MSTKIYIYKKDILVEYARVFVSRDYKHIFRKFVWNSLFWKNIKNFRFFIKWARFSVRRVYKKIIKCARISVLGEYKKILEISISWSKCENILQISIFG